MKVWLHSKSLSKTKQKNKINTGMVVHNNLSTWEVKEEDQKYKAILNYIMGLSPAWKLISKRQSLKKYKSNWTCWHILRTPAIYEDETGWLEPWSKTSLSIIGS